MDMGIVDNRYRWYSCGMCHTLVSMYINLCICIYYVYVCIEAVRILVEVQKEARGQGHYCLLVAGP